MCKEPYRVVRNQQRREEFEDFETEQDSNAKSVLSNTPGIAAADAFPRPDLCGKQGGGFEKHPLG